MWKVLLGTFGSLARGNPTTCINSAGESAPCAPGHEFCGKPFENAPVFHLMDQHGCVENDPNGPVFDPVHGVMHHFYQIHLAAPPGHGPNYGHFVSKDFVKWAALPVAIWNGFDSSTTPAKPTPYDNEAIFTGSAFVVEGAGPGGTEPGVVQIYPGLCNVQDWPACKTGTVLAQAVPADYATDELLTNWSKPSYNPIMENTQRDPSSPWKTPSGEWRLRTYDSRVYASASDADVLAGKWYEVGLNKDFHAAECPSFYPLPAATPGFEREYDIAMKAGSLPTHVHKTSSGDGWQRDGWQLGTYVAGKPREADRFIATPGWEPEFQRRVIDQGRFYASKDNEYPSKNGAKRRINWGWATVPPASAQTLPREISFNVPARVLQQYPIDEIAALRGPAAYSQKDLLVQAGRPTNFGLRAGVARQSEIVASFRLPDRQTVFGVSLLNGANMSCNVDYTPPGDASAAYYEVPVECGNTKDVLRLLPGENVVEIRIFSDWIFLEAYFQRGRVAMTVTNAFSSEGDLALASGAADVKVDVNVFPIDSIWTTADEVRKAPRVYPKASKPLVVV